MDLQALSEGVGRAARRMTPADLRAARHKLGLTQKGLAQALKMGTWGWQSVSKWERDGSTIPGPVQVAVESLLRSR